MRILIGVAAGSVVGFVTGMWGSKGGLAAMLAGVVSVGLLPLVAEWVEKRKAKTDRPVPPP
jgi:hypothetical protein